MLKMLASNSVLALWETQVTNRVRLRYLRFALTIAINLSMINKITQHKTTMFSIRPIARSGAELITIPKQNINQLITRSWATREDLGEAATNEERKEKHE